MVQKLPIITQKKMLTWWTIWRCCELKLHRTTNRGHTYKKRKITWCALRRTFLFFFFFFTTQTELSPALSTANMTASASAVVMCKLSIPGQPWQPQTKPHLPSSERSVPLRWVWTFAVLNDCSDRPNIYIPRRHFAGVFGMGITSFFPPNLYGPACQM